MTDQPIRCSLNAFVKDSLASSDDWLGISFWELEEGPSEKLAGKALIRESIALLEATLAILGSSANERLFPYVSFCLPPTDELQSWRQDLLDLPGWGDNSLNLSKDREPFFWGVKERYSRRISLAFMDAPEFFVVYTSHTGEDWDSYENDLAIFPDYWYSKAGD